MCSRRYYWLESCVPCEKKVLSNGSTKPRSNNKLNWSKLSMRVPPENILARWKTPVLSLRHWTGSAKERFGHVCSLSWHYMTTLVGNAVRGPSRRVHGIVMEPAVQKTCNTGERGYLRFTIRHVAFCGKLLSSCRVHHGCSK